MHSCFCVYPLMHNCRPVRSFGRVCSECVASFGRERYVPLVGGRAALYRDRRPYHQTAVISCKLTWLYIVQTIGRHGNNTPYHVHVLGPAAACTHADAHRRAHASTCVCTCACLFVVELCLVLWPKRLHHHRLQHVECLLDR